MTISCLGYLGLTTTKLDEWPTFSETVLGMMPVSAPDGELRYRIDDQAWRISITAGPEDDIAYAGYEAASTADFEDVKSRLTAMGIAFHNGDEHLKRKRQVTDLICFKDPQGTNIEVYYGPDLATEVPFTSPVGVKGFKTAQQGLGHIFLLSTEIPALRQFYMDALGFTLSDIIHMPLGTPESVDLEFYHCNKRHHTIGMAPVKLPRKLHHFMLETHNLDDVGYALDRARDNGIPVTMGLGKHTNDRMISFYVRSPGGFEVEFGYDGVAIDEHWRITRHTSASSWGHRRTE